MYQSCGTCQHHIPVEMSQGELTEIRCGHPAVLTAKDHETCPDWIIDANSFTPHKETECHGWIPDEDTQYYRDLDQLEQEVRQQIPELGCLSNMGLNFLRTAIHYLYTKPQPKE